MKKGCFLSFLTFLTISLGVVFYLSKNHIVTFDKLIRPFVVSKIKDKFDKTVSNVKSSPEKDSLVSALNRYLLSIENDKDFSIKANENFFNELNITLRDTLLDSSEISRLIDLFNKNLTSSHARQKKNTD